MVKTRIPLFDLKISPRSRREVDRVLKSGWLNTGARAVELERRIAHMDGVRYAAAVSSATAGLQLTLRALGVGGGAEVITTPFTFVATTAVILQNGATPVYGDIDTGTFNLDPDEIERKITPKTAAVLPVDIAGGPADYERIAEICARRKVPLIADAAHSLGALLRGKPVARWVDAAVHSFQATKNLTCADGGMVTSKHKIVVERVRLLARHAMTSSAFERRQTGGWFYDVVGLGYKANMTDVHAAIGLGQLASFEKSQKRRAVLAARYSERLADLEEFLQAPTVITNGRHAWHLYIIRLHLSRLKFSRAAFIKKMAAVGIECGVHYRPIFEMSFYKGLGLDARYLPNAAYVGERVVTLPLYPELKDSNVDYVCECIHHILRR